MIQGIIIKKLDKYSDDRGWLTEIYRQDETEYRPAMSYISETKPGVARGPHEHENQTDCFIFLGPGSFRVYLWDNREESSTFKEKQEVEAGEGNPMLVLVPPGVVHGYKCISESPGRVINLPDKLFKGEGKKQEIDEVRWEDDADSEFKIA